MTTELYDYVKKYGFTIFLDPEAMLKDTFLLDVFSRLEKQKVKDLFCIIIPYANFEPYIKFCLADALGTKGIESGLFRSIMFKNVRINVSNTIDGQLAWQTFLWHIPGARDLKWVKDKK